MAASIPVITPATLTARLAHQHQTPEAAAGRPKMGAGIKPVITHMSAVVRKPVRLLIRTAIAITVIPASPKMSAGLKSVMPADQNRDLL